MVYIKSFNKIRIIENDNINEISLEENLLDLNYNLNSLNDKTIYYYNLLNDKINNINILNERIDDLQKNINNYVFLLIIIFIIKYLRLYI
jgi:hypothetical protein